MPNTNSDILKSMVSGKDQREVAKNEWIGWLRNEWWKCGEISLIRRFLINICRSIF